MTKSERLIWLDGHMSTKSYQDVLSMQGYDPELGYYFEYDEHLFVFRGNKWYEIELEDNKVN